MAESASEVRTLVPCPLCGRSLYPAPVAATLTFHCKTGHELPLGELLRAQSAGLKGGLEVLLAEWNRQHRALLDTVDDARKNGFLDVAEIFNRHARSLESRIDKVRDAFSNADSSKLIQLPESMRSGQTDRNPTSGIV
jgi:hypothetical protein